MHGDVCTTHLVGWCLTALSVQKGYIMPQDSSVLRQLRPDDHDEDKQLKQ